MRAQVLRLSDRGEGVGRIVAHTGRSEASVSRDLDRWEERGLKGLIDGTAPVNLPRITGEVQAFLEKRVGEEERLEYWMVESPCRIGEVVSYLEALAREAERARQPVVVVLDNAPFQRPGRFEPSERGGRLVGCASITCPSYCLCLSTIEGYGAGSRASWYRVASTTR